MSSKYMLIAQMLAHISKVCVKLQIPCVVLNKCNANQW